MIKAQNTGLRIILTGEDLKASSRGKGCDVTLDDFNISHEDIFKADLIELTMTSDDGIVLWGKTFKDRYRDATKDIWVKSAEITRDLLNKEKEANRAARKWWQIWEKNT
jgi:hypothetical protein